MVSLQLISYSCQSILNPQHVQPSPSSTHPHIIGYNVSHNAIGMVQMYGTTDTDFVIETASLNFFRFTVVAFNVLVEGKE